ncbi:MAG: competence protein CoiA family protein [Candidatus Binatus sp.]
MPLSCLRDGDLLASFQLSDDEWTGLRANYRNMHLSMRCCSRAAIPKVSSLGTRFFAHRSRGACQTAPESPEHLKAKFVIAQSARAVGWRASTEESGSDADGNPWTADVLCIRGKAKVAFEVQLSPQSLEDYEARQKRYERTGIRCLWLMRLRRNSSALNSFTPSRELPLVLLDVKEPASMTVLAERSSGATIPLADFVKGALAGDFFWAEMRPGRILVELQIASITCWKCHSPIKAIRGYIINDQFVALAKISDTDAVAIFAEALRKQEPRVTPVSQRYSQTRGDRYFAASCPSCRALMGDWPMTADFFIDHCNYLTCSCPNTNVHMAELACSVFEYHQITLNVGHSELADFPPGEWKWRHQT